MARLLHDWSTHDLVINLSSVICDALRLLFARIRGNPGAVLHRAFRPELMIRKKYRAAPDEAYAANRMTNDK